MRSSDKARRVSLALVLALLGCSFLLSAPGSSAGQNSDSKAAKQNAAAAKRLHRQREHMERQRARIKKNRERLKAQRGALRRKLQAETAEVKAQTKVDPAHACDCEGEEGTADNSQTDIWAGFFPWASEGGFSDNLLAGLGLAALGAIGALILIFVFLGSYLPSMGGKAEYMALQVEISALTKRRDQMLASREGFVRNGTDLGTERRQEATKLTEDLGAVIKSKEDEASRKYRQVLWLGIPIYVVVGGVLAVLLATNALQALLIGFAWTSIADRMGLRREESEKESVKEENVAKFEGFVDEKDRKITDLEAELKAVKQGVTEATLSAARIKGSK